MTRKSTGPKVSEGKPSRASFHPGSTTQGGSDFGQGATSLGDAKKQGSEKNDGADYGNESGWNNEALRTSDYQGYNEHNPGKTQGNFQPDSAKQPPTEKKAPHGKKRSIAEKKQKETTKK
ncbi:MAG TPA: hypothetical protein VGH64_09920 [Puia sp.]